MPLKANTSATGKRTLSADTSASSTPISEKLNIPDETVLPLFLRQTTAEITAKFNKLNLQQQHRLEHAARSDASSSSPWVQDHSREAKIRNRYFDIKPWMSTRIKLKVPDGGFDYINASPIVLNGSLANDKRNYIATQGPKENGIDQFWQMVWDETDNVAVIVMLTRLIEGIREKCFQYYPEDETSEPLELNFTTESGEELDATLKVESSVYDELSKTTLRTLTLECDSRAKSVYHFLFLGWPDHGVPEDVDRSALLELIKISRLKNEGWENPRIVHCSAGVGRTGTFIALEHLLAELSDGRLDNLPSSQQPPADPIYDTVNTLREQRMLMVQSDEQYRFLYSSLAEACRARARERAIEAQVDSKITAAGEPAHKAVRLTRQIKNVISNFRSRSSSRKDESRRKKGERDEGKANTPDEQQLAEGCAAGPVQHVEHADDSRSRDTSPQESTLTTDGTQSTGSLQLSSNADTGLTQEAHRVGLEEVGGEDESP